MFDVGFSEIVVIGVVALIVIGPERLPKVARTLGHLFGRAQRYVNTVKADINREMNLEELNKLQTQIQDAAQTFQQSIHQTTENAQAEMQAISQQVSSNNHVAPVSSSVDSVPDQVIADVASQQLNNEAAVEAAFAEALKVRPEVVHTPEVSPQMELELPPAPLMYEKKS